MNLVVRRSKVIFQSQNVLQWLAEGVFNATVGNITEVKWGKDITPTCSLIVSIYSTTLIWQNKITASLCSCSSGLMPESSCTGDDGAKPDVRLVKMNHWHLADCIPFTSPVIYVCTRSSRAFQSHTLLLTVSAVILHRAPLYQQHIDTLPDVLHLIRFNNS